MQVPCDSDIPDNIYTGKIYYETIGSNKWIMRFSIIQNVKVFLQVSYVIIIIIIINVLYNIFLLVYER